MFEYVPVQKIKLNFKKMTILIYFYNAGYKINMYKKIQDSKSLVCVFIYVI